MDTTIVDTSHIRWSSLQVVRGRQERAIVMEREVPLFFAPNWMVWKKLTTNHEFVGHFRNQNYVENHIYVNVDLGVTKNESTTMIRGLIKDNG